VHDHLYRRASPARASTAQPAPRIPNPRPAGAYDVARVLELQRLAGNSRVTMVLQRSEEGTEDEDEH
jgi:hypothetical protein